MPDHDAELDAIVATLSEAGLVEGYIDEDGAPALRRTRRGRQLGPRWR